MELNLRQIFSKETEQPTVENNSEGSPLIHSDRKIRDNESFINYGKRLCGIVNGNLDFLPIFFQQVIEAEKNKYIKDGNLTAEHREKTQAKISDKETQKNIKENQLNETLGQITEIEEEIQHKNGEINQLRIDGCNNKGAKVKFYFGLSIILLLTVYLFIFYSSTFYSAFFGSDTVEGVSDAMFNTQAIGKAFGLGFGAVIFVCTAPVIFMALGYALHYFALQKGVGKYIKIVGCIIVTFIFDCLLAYSIGAKCYDYIAMNSLSDMPPYSMSKAFNDVNVWIVIFCGFVTYMIWGIVLDMVITAYGDYVSNDSTISKIKNEIEGLKQKNEVNRNKVSNLREEISVIEGELQKLQKSLDNVIIPVNVIKEAVSDFYAGWSAVVSVLTPTEYDNNKAQKHYDNCIANINSSEIQL